MPDRRTVDDLTIEELEQVLRMKKREARMDRLRRYEEQGRRRADAPLPEDIITATSSLRVEPPPPAKSRTLRDNLLLAIEILAALGLITLVIFAANTIRQINMKAAEQQSELIADLPTPNPTPIISAVVLPSGHTPPTSPEGVQPNYNEVPAHLRPRVEQQYAGPVVVPTAAPGTAIRIQIPAIAVDAPIIMGDGWEQLKKGVGQHLGTANPGEVGNMVLSAHNDVFGQIFRDLNELQIGDEIIVETSGLQTHTYLIADKRVVDPTDIQWMGQTQEPVVTLISCYPYLVDTHRIVVVGTLEEN